MAPLTVLVLNKESGLPGEGLSTIEEIDKDRETLFDFDWFSIEPPQNSDFAEAEQN
jgi:putative restriction endonuclease